MRRLSADERALWARVTRDVRVAHRSAQDARHEPQAPATRARTDLSGHSAPAVTKPVAARKSDNNLDGSWDRRLATGRVDPERTVDLHGYSLAAAHARLDRALANAVGDGIRILLVVTGRPPPRGANRIDASLRGVIRASIGDWLAASAHSRDIAAIRGAHRRHGGAGALYLVFRRATSIRS